MPIEALGQIKHMYIAPHDTCKCATVYITSINNTGTLRSTWFGEYKESNEKDVLMYSPCLAIVGGLRRLEVCA